MPEGLKLDPNGRYLEKLTDGRIFIWTKRLAMRTDMREFDPEFDAEGALVKRKNTAERMAELERQNTELERRNAELEARGDESILDEATPETLTEDTDTGEDNPTILGDLEEELVVPAPKITREFLLTKEPAELRDFAFKVFGEKLNVLKKQETLVDDILELKKQQENI